MLLPFHPRTITSRFGRRRHPTTGQRDFHHGIDLAVADGSPIRLPYDAVIVAKSHGKDVGNRLTVDVGTGVRLKLNHLREISDYPVGELVPAGRRIARVGATGAGATGPHLCLELWVDGRNLDPLTYELDG